MKKFKAVIVDDEKHGRENLRFMLNEYCKNIEVTGEASSVNEALIVIDDTRPHVVFLDILMPKLDGFGLLDLMPNRKFVVVFVSASHDFGIKAVKAGVLDYLLKPINAEELEAAVSKIQNHYDVYGDDSYVSEVNEKKIVLSKVSGFAIEEMNDIMVLQADSNYTKVYCKEGKKYHVSKPLKEFEKVLPGDSFLRIHRSYIINLNYLMDFNNNAGGGVILKNGFRIPVSKRREPALNNVLRKLKFLIN